MTTVPPPAFDRTDDFVPVAADRREELRSYRSLVRLVGRSVGQPAASAGASAILVPGFVSGDVSLSMLARYLRRQGHRTFASDIGANLGCTDAMVERLTRRMERVVADEGRRVAVVGHSRGGMVVKLAAQRRPDLVVGVVVLSGPVTGTLAVAPHVRKQLELLFRLHRRGLTGVIGQDCVTGECAARIAAELDSPFPSGVAYTSVYSRTDAIIDYRTCLDPAAELVEVDSTHTGMSTDLGVAGIVADCLAAVAS